MREFARFLRTFPQLAAEEGFSFARHTSIGCGGRAALCVFPASFGEAEAVLSYLLREGIPHFLLGAGANVLPPDEDYRGVVVKFTKLCALERRGEAVFAGAGATGGALLRFSREEGLGGLEPFAGIPMTVGGGVTMNAGVPALHFSDAVERVVGVENGRLRTFSNAECKFLEKFSLFQSGIAVLGALLRTREAPREEIAKREALFRAKRAHLPKGRSMGCTFVNPEGCPAGKLIEACGLKGRRVGGARVSCLHANFILNEGGTAADVGRLIDLVKEEVLQKTGILLREEIRRIPLPPPVPMESGSNDIK